MVMEVTSYPLLWFPRVAALRVCAPARSHVRSWLISSAVWIQRRPSLFFLQNGRQGMSQQRISQFLQTCHYAQEHAFTHVDPQEFVRTKLYQFAPIRSKLISRLLFFFFVKPDFSQKQNEEKTGNSNRWCCLTELTISLPRSEIGSTQLEIITL